MAIEVPQNEEIYGGVGFAIRRRKANRGSVNVKKRERGGDVDLYIIRVWVKRRKREVRKFREG